MRYIALIRGINVGTAKRVAMADLRASLAVRGLTDVKTLLNSGNVIFSAAGGKAGHAATIAAALHQDCGVQAGVVVLSAPELTSIIAANGLTKIATDPSRLLITIYASPADRVRFTPLAETGWAPDALQIGPAALYAWCQAGAIDSKLARAVTRAMGPHATTRNWATLQKLQALAGE
jgi:uncharacterized protein (DUF1697 family)